MTKYLHKPNVKSLRKRHIVHYSHNVYVLVYHLAFPTKYRRVAIADHVDEVIKETCIEIEKGIQCVFLKSEQTQIICIC